MPTISRSQRQARKPVLIVLLAFSALSLTNAITWRTEATNQEKEVKNPFAGNAKIIKEGRGLFLLSCAYCHGIDARGGGRGPDLVTRETWTHGDTDADLLRTVTKGVAGTDMPSCNCAEEEAWKMISYIRSLSTKSSAPVAGDRAAGEKIFFGRGSCNACHIVDGKGGLFGPDLSRVGAARPIQYIIDSIREPSTDIPSGYETVTALTKDGRRITGVRKNEDTFTLQLFDQGEQHHLFLKKDLKEVIYEPKSLMPAYSEQRLSQKDLQDLLAYLDSLRGKQRGQQSQQQRKRL